MAKNFNDWLKETVNEDKFMILIALDLQID